MHEDDPEIHMLEWLKLHGTPEQRAEYRACAERKRRMTEDHETRLRSLEIGMTEVKGQLRDMATEAHETRIEQNSTLRIIVDELKSIAKDQHTEAGRREGNAAAVALALQGENRRDSWAQAALPYAVAMIIFAMGAWIVAVQQGTEANAVTEVHP